MSVATPERIGHERARLDLASRLMAEFAAATGLVGAQPRRRYLWTDAFAVTNFLGLSRATGEGRFLDLALALVDQVHHELGRHRADDPRHGWISGLDEASGERHPTCGGLRIGKPLPERPPGAPFDAELEWERDGQYFHYLTQWMNALRLVGEETGQAIFLRWAVELAKSAHARFVVKSAAGAPQRMVWKMSIALDRALVPSTGQHDALDAWVTYQELARVELDDGGSALPGLEREIEEAAALCGDGGWATDDPLGAGALLLALHRLARLEARGAVVDTRRVDALLEASRSSLEACSRRDPSGGLAGRRLAFRELGLAIGLHALERLDGERTPRAAIRKGIAELLAQSALAERIDRFWCDPAARASASWRAHSDINTVMLATSLAPDGYLGTTGTTEARFR